MLSYQQVCEWLGYIHIRIAVRSKSTAPSFCHSLTTPSDIHPSTTCTDDASQTTTLPTESVVESAQPQDPTPTSVFLPTGKDQSDIINAGI